MLTPTSGGRDQVSKGQGPGLPGSDQVSKGQGPASDQVVRDRFSFSAGVQVVWDRFSSSARGPGRGSSFKRSC